MNQKRGYKTDVVKGAVVSRSFFGVFAALVKLRLSLTVVFSSVLAYGIAAGAMFSWRTLLLLGIGGFFTTAAANTLNQVLEREYDKWMKRTQTRPLVVGTLDVPTAVLLAGLMSLAGIMLLGLIHPLAAFVGMLSLILYSFVYTPLKRVGNVSVWVGAIPGALPVVIGVVAFTGQITPLAVLLFAIQFFWQFPHFWAIAWLGHEDYKRAGFHMLPSSHKDKWVGFYAMFFAALIIPVLWIAFSGAYILAMGFAILLILTIVYIYLGYRLFSLQVDKAALHLMLFSFMYLPLSLVVILMEQLIL